MKIIFIRILKISPLQLIHSHLSYLITYIERHMSMSVDVKVEGIEKVEIEHESNGPANSRIAKENKMQTVEAHKVTLRVILNDNNSFRFIHVVYPIADWNSSIEKAQAQLLNLSVELQNRLNKPIK